jgi:tetratricopeptide (TPR) repeat protein
MQPGEVIADRFELERLAAEGAMGTVWRARDRRDGGAIALKVERGVESERVMREAQILAEVKHESIIKLVAYGTDARFGTWLAMEWIEGHDLMKELEKGPLPLVSALALARRVAGALGSLHARGVLHRDVKPTNIMLPGGRIEEAKLLDLGLARIQSAPRTTRAGQTLGTPGYMAPEQARGLVQIDARADVFSLGCVLFECISGAPVFAGDHYVAVLAKVLMQDIPRLSDVVSDAPAEIDELLARMLAKDPAQRPENGTAALREIEIAAEHVTPSARDVALRRVDSGPPATLSESEAYIASVVLAAPGVASQQAIDNVRNFAASVGASIEMLPDGSLFGLLARRGQAREQAAAAAKLALVIRWAMPNRVCVLATGRTALGARYLVGEAIDRASALLGAPPRDGVRLDEVTAGLLGSRFVVDQLVLTAEREVTDDPRAVLGKAVPCVGRERELATLEGLYDEAAQGAGARVVIVTGAAGVGKSRVLHELVQRLRRRESTPSIWVGRGDPMSAGSPLAILADALRRALGIHAAEPIEVRRDKIRARAGERVAWFIGEMVGAPFDANVSEEIASARKDPQLMADQTRQAFEELVLAELARRPLVLVLEDLHWGDAGLVSFVDSLLRVAEHKPLFVVATGRGDLNERFPLLWDRRHPTQIKLAELSARSAGQLVRAMLPTIPAERVGKLVDLAAGNALFLEELVRAEAEGRGGATPGSVLAMVTSRIDSLGPELRKTLRAASVFGRTTWRGALQSLLQIDARALGEILGELTTREIFVEMPDAKFPGEEEFLFRHEIVREAAYKMLTDADRAIAHAQAGKWLEAAGERDGIVLAEHYDKGGQADRAIAQYLRATQQALDSSDLDAAYAHAERGIALGASWEICGELRSRQADIMSLRGEYDQARSLGELALADLEPRSAAWCQAASALIADARRRGDAARAEALAAQLLDAPAAPGPCLRAAMVFLQYGREDLAEALAKKGEGAKAPFERCRLHEYRLLRHKSAGDVASAIAEGELATAAAHEANNLRLVCRTQSNLGDALKEVGAYAAASRVLDDTVKIAERLGYEEVKQGALQNLGLTRAREGSLADGLAIERAAAAAFERRGDRRMLGGSKLYLAIMLLGAGDLEQAEANARDACSAFADVPSLLHVANAALARVLVARGRAREAVADVRAAVEFLDGGGRMEEGEALVRLAWAEALVALGDADNAKTAIVAARRALLERASRIGNETYRKSFLEAVPEHARTTELYVWQNTAADSGGT